MDLLVIDLCVAGLVRFQPPIEQWIGLVNLHIAVSQEAQHPLSQRKAEHEHRAGEREIFQRALPARGTRGHFRTASRAHASISASRRREESNSSWRSVPVSV